MTKEERTHLIKNKALEMGFSFVGISKASYLDKDAERLEKWLNSGYHGKMSYMENHFDKRVDPRKLVEGAKSIISLLYNYHPKSNPKQQAYKVSKYAYGEDYHVVIKDKLKQLMAFITTEIGEVNGRSFVDSAPVLDRAWARESGLGWIGKNGMLITKEKGSEFFIAELIIDLELDYDGPIKDYCGTCTKCIDDCPTEAILPDKQLDARKCISYLTIELRDEVLPNEFKDRMEDWVFGCDICQDVCPWNRFSSPHNERRFDPVKDLLEMTKEDWEDLSQSTFNALFKKSALKRTKYTGLKRNISFIKR